MVTEGFQIFMRAALHLHASQARQTRALHTPPIILDTRVMNHFTLCAGLLECTPSPGLAACTITLNMTTAGSYLLSLQQDGVPVGCSPHAAAAQVCLMQHVTLHL